MQPPDSENSPPTEFASRARPGPRSCPTKYRVRSIRPYRRSSIRRPASLEERRAHRGGGAGHRLHRRRHRSIFSRAGGRECRRKSLLGAAAGRCGHRAAGDRGSGSGASGADGGMVRDDDLCARQRLRRQVAGGYRRSRQKGQVLATIETPELDAELAAARAQLKASEAQVVAREGRGRVQQDDQRALARFAERRGVRAGTRVQEGGL